MEGCKRHVEVPELSPYCAESAEDSSHRAEPRELPRTGRHVILCRFAPDLRCSRPTWSNFPPSPETAKYIKVHRMYTRVLTSWIALCFDVQGERAEAKTPTKESAASHNQDQQHVGVTAGGLPLAVHAHIPRTALTADCSLLVKL